MSMHRLVLPSAVLLALSSVPAAAAPAKDLTATLVEKRIQDLSSSGLVLSFRLNVANSSRNARDLVHYQYRVTVNGKEYLNLSVGLDDPIRVAAGGETAIALPVKVTYRLLRDAVGALGDRAACQLSGDLVFRDERGREDKVGLNLAGEFPIFQDPTVDLGPLEVKTLTVGGADLVFNAQFGNPNPYDLLVEKIAFKLDLGEGTVLSGEVPGDKDMPARGARPVAVPFILDFFESGNNLYELLKSGSVPCFFRGEIFIASVWGPLRIPFEVKGRLAAGTR